MLCDELVWGQIPEQAVRTPLIVVEPPGFNDLLHLDYQDTLVHVQTLVSQSAINRFTEGISHGFARPNKVELRAMTIGPIFERPRLEFGPVIHGDGAGV